MPAGLMSSFHLQAGCMKPSQVQVNEDLHSLRLALQADMPMR